MHYAHFSRNFEKQKTQFVAFLECVFKTFAEYEAGFSSKGDKVTKNQKAKFMITPYFFRRELARSREPSQTDQ